MVNILQGSVKLHGDLSMLWILAFHVIAVWLVWGIILPATAVCLSCAEPER